MILDEYRCDECFDTGTLKIVDPNGSKVWIDCEYCDAASVRRASARVAARRSSFIAGVVAANPDLDEQQVQEMADEYIRHSEEQR